jgi:hypothetical protein
MRRKEKWSTWGLQTAVQHRLWMTPKARDADFHTPSTSGRSREMSTHLGTQVMLTRDGLLTTPCADDTGLRTERYQQGGTPLSMQVAAMEGMLPTPNASKAGNDISLTCSGDGREKPNKLGWAVAMLPTPRAIYGEHPGMTDPKHLTGAAMLPTPRHEGFDAGSHGDALDSLHSYAKMLPTPQEDNANNVTRRSGNRASDLVRSTYQEGLKLNPEWVSRMMGYPDGWMDVGEATP